MTVDLKAKVVDLKAYKLSLKPHVEGPAICLYCEHRWRAVTPVGTFEMECPSCGLFKGVWVGLFSPETMFQCACGGLHFTVTHGAIACVICGKHHKELPE